MCGWPTFYDDCVISYFEISKFVCEGEECATLKKKGYIGNGGSATKTQMVVFWTRLTHFLKFTRCRFLSNEFVTAVI